jgi:hypothetical protein
MGDSRFWRRKSGASLAVRTVFPSSPCTCPAKIKVKPRPDLSHLIVPRQSGNEHRQVLSLRRRDV